MRLKFFLMIIIATVSFAQSITSIISLRENDQNGNPVHLGSKFTVGGIVTSSNEFGNNGPASIQDETAGISIYGSGFAGVVDIGDSVTVTSTVAQFNGLTQLDFFSSGSVVTVHRSNVSLNPRIVTIEEILNQRWNGVEELEGLLIRLNGVSINASGTFSGNSNYNITDGSSTMEMRIDNDVSSISGSSIPSSEIDLIGILGQYDPSGTKSDGYQILPRFISDIVTSNEPLILSPIIPADISHSSFTVYFNTAREGDSEIRYGLTTGLEIDTMTVEESVKTHKIKIENLLESTKYYFQVLSSNAEGKSKSPILSVNTSSSDTSTGKINVYFNYSIDNTVAILDNNANGNINLKNKLLTRINSASHSLDLAVYSFYGLNDVANAIISARDDRDVKVRVVYDNRSMQSSMQLLADAGIPIKKRSDNDGLMHNKFLIVDARDSINNNDWVWTGSWNWNPLNNRNNVIEINDPALAKAYTVEFEEMFGSSDDNPTSSAKFGPNKVNNTTHYFNIGGRNVELFFSPSDATESQISSVLSTADTSIFFGLLSFTSDPIFNSINSRFNNGVTDIRGIIDNVEDTGGEYNNLKAISEVFDYGLSGVFHHKYAMVDSYSSSSDPIVITGSHNWSRSANEKNDENTLIIHDQLIANQYMQEFKSRYNELGGTKSFDVPKITGINNHDGSPLNNLFLSQNYPNPFNPTTSIQYSIPSYFGEGKNYVNLTIYNSLGQIVKKLVDESQRAGLYNVTFNGRNLTSGIYFYTLRVNNNIITKKMLLLK